MLTHSRPAKTFFPNLDGLRTLACLAVFGFHSLITIMPKNTAPTRVFSVFVVGTMGVNFFYVLSGFLITYLLLEEEKQYQRVDLHEFYRRRVLRIWPLFYACVAYGFLVVPLLMHLFRVPYHETANLDLHMAFLGNLDTVWQGVQPTSSGLAVLWSVAIEEQFYLVWPVLLMFLFRQWRPGAFLLVIAVSLVFRYGHYANEALIYRHSLAVMSDMAMGGAAAWACFSFPALREHIAGWSRWTIAGLYVAAVALFVAQKMLPFSPGAVAVQRIVRSVLFVLVILEQNYATNSWFKLKNSRWLTYWGTFTYGFYCLHPIVLDWLVFASERLHLPSTPLNTVLRMVVGLPLSAGLAWLSFTYWERPFLKLKNHRTPVASASSAHHTAAA
jgi:peptidoglycan/LPS O-acetylase OafA/YrhL